MEQKQTMVRISEGGYEFVKGYAKSMGISMNAFMLMLIWDFKRGLKRAELAQVFSEKELTELEIGMYAERKKTEGV